MAIPRGDDPFADWIAVFAAGLTSNGPLYGVSAPDALTVQTSADSYTTGLAVSKNPATRNVGTIDAKDVLKIAARSVCAVFYGNIQRNNAVSNEDKLLIGVTPIATSRTKRNCPQNVPGVNAVAVTQGAHTLTYFNSIDPSDRAKPFGATEIELFVAIAADEVDSPTDAKFYRKFTTNPMAVFFQPADKGKVATYFARWAGIRGDTSPFSAGVSLPIAA